MDKIEYTPRPKKQLVATSLRIEKSILVAIDNYGAQVDRSRNWLINKLLKRSLSEMQQ